MNESALPENIQAIKFATIGRCIESDVPVEKFSRVKTLVLSDASNLVQFKLKGLVDESGKLLIELDLSAKLAMTCQSCLEPMTVVVDSSVSFCPVFDDEQAQALPKRLEPLIVDEDAQVRVLDLVEDELLLSLPVAPVHENECMPVLDCSSDAETVNNTPEKENPFSVLQSLKKE